MLLWASVVAIILFAFSSCSRKQRNTEVNFTVFYELNERGLDKHQRDSCRNEKPYDQVYAAGKGALTICASDSVKSYTEFPIDINYDTSVFIFRKKMRTDTLTLAYSRRMISDGNDFSMDIHHIHAVKATFEHAEIKCKSKSSNCDEVESITVYY